jgi:hypothetical protein
VSVDKVRIGIATPPGMTAATDYFSAASTLGYDQQEGLRFEMYYGEEPGRTAQALGLSGFQFLGFRIARHPLLRTLSLQFDLQRVGPTGDDAAAALLSQRTADRDDVRGRIREGNDPLSAGRTTRACDAMGRSPSSSQPLDVTRGFRLTLSEYSDRVWMIPWLLGWSCSALQMIIASA